jgi:hypothetical protein
MRMLQSCSQTGFVDGEEKEKEKEKEEENQKLQRGSRSSGQSVCARDSLKTGGGA